MTDSLLLPETEETDLPAEPAAVNEDSSPLVGAEDTVLEVPIYPEMDAEPLAAKPVKKHRFLKGLSVYLAVWIVLIAVGLWFFYVYLDRYEAATPNAALNNYVKWIQTENYEAIIAASDFEETVLNTKEEFVKYLSRLFEGDTTTLAVRERVTSNDDRKEYSLYIEDKRVCGLSLIHNPKWGETAWSYVTEIQYQEPTVIYAADTVRLEINGTDVSLLGITGTPAADTILGSVDDPSALPCVYAYTLNDLLNPPTIEALTLGGDSCQVVMTADNTYCVYTPTDEAVRTKHEELAKSTAFTYAAFVGKDAARSDVLKLVYKDSALYDTIRNFSNGWFTKHDSYEFKDVSITNYAQFTSTDFSCDVSFTPVYIRNNKKLENAPFHCRLSFVLMDDQWKLVSLVQKVAEQNTETTTPTTGTGTTTAA